MMMTIITKWPGSGCPRVVTRRLLVYKNGGYKIKHEREIVPGI